MQESPGFVELLKHGLSRKSSRQFVEPALFASSPKRRPLLQQAATELFPGLFEPPNHIGDLPVLLRRLALKIKSEIQLFLRLRACVLNCGQFLANTIENCLRS